jgi:putative nucleotidyltransferase with HDIG domain
MAESAAKGIDLEAAVREMMGTRSIPISPYPGVAMRLQKLVSSQSYGTQDLVKIAGSEPVVVSQLLRTANSAAFVGTGKATSLSGAVSRLGGAEVVRIAIAACVGADAGKRGPLAAVRRRIWQEAITSALLATQLAHARNLNKDTAFVCGLLHDIGRVVAAGAIELVLEKRRDNRALPEATWLAMIDRLHVELGAAVAAHWGLPPDVQAAVALHHQTPGGSEHEPMLQAVRATDKIVPLMMTHPQITEAHLVDTRVLTSGEVTLLLDAIPKIGPLVAGLAEVPSTGPEVKSQVERAKPVTVTAVLDASFPLTVVRAENSIAGQCRRVTWTTLGATLKQPLMENFLCKLRLEPPGVPAFEVHARVLTCAPITGGYDVEAQLFALGGATKESWGRLVRSQGGAGVEAAS